MRALRPFVRLGLVVAACSAVLVGTAPAASAHPLGNATVNHYDGLTLHPDRIDDLAVEDIAEIPTVQRKRQIDTDLDGTLSPAERTTYAAAQCAALARAERVAVDGHPVTMRVTSSEYSERPGVIQLTIGRLVCLLGAPADLRAPAKVSISDQWDGQGIGWHEITAVADGVTLQRSPFPARSISGQLLHYPNDLLSSPLDVRSGTVSTTPGTGTSTYSAAKALPGAGFLTRALNGLTTTFNGLVGRKHMTVGVGLLAILLAMLLGAGHAFLPGHGKTIMAAYLVGRRGRLRDVVTVGATVTITHTAGVLVLGLLISVSTAFAPTAAEQVLGVVSGLIVAAVGLGLLVSAVRRVVSGRAGAVLDGIVATEVTVVDPPTATSRPLVDALAHAHPSHDTLAGVDPGPTDTDDTAVGPAAEAHGAGHPHPHSHSHGHPHHHDHGHPHGHSHSPSERGFSRGGLVGLGVAGGLVPSPSALLVLLAAIALGRTAFGVIVVLGYGVGMALALSAAGLLLVRLRHHADRLAGPRLASMNRLLAALPVLTAALVLLVGIWLAARAAGGTL